MALTYLGLLCRQTDMAGLRRWAAGHWQTLKGTLGFTRKKPPHATTISRAAATFSPGQFRDAFARWVKTSKQGHDARGEPVHMLNVFAHELNPCLARFPVTGGKPTEPQSMKGALTELLEHHPFPRLFTADALFPQRPPARVILGAGRGSLSAVEDNQPDLLEAVLTSSGDVTGREPVAKSVGNKGTSCTPEGSGWSRR